MPATEETKYNQKKMHVLFAVTAVIMFVATIWMLTKDYVREWKQYQLDFREVNRWTDEARFEEAKMISAERRREAEEKLQAAQRSPVVSEDIQEFNKLAKDEDARLNEAGAAFPPTDTEKLEQLRTKLDEVIAASPASAEVEKARTDLMTALSDVISEAKRREDALALEMKFAKAEHTAKVSELGIAIDEAKPDEVVQDLQASIDSWQEKIEDLGNQVGAANSYRVSLENVLRNKIRQEELAAKKDVDTIHSEIGRLQDQAEMGFFEKLGDKIARAPILEAFNNTDIGIKQIWLPDMKIDYNFSKVARFDRCTSCHRAIDRTAPGSAVEPLYPPIPADQRDRTLALETPDARPGADADEVSADDEEKSNGEMAPESILKSAYGIVLADKGQIDDVEVTIQFVVPNSAAARSGLMTGDVIRTIGGNSIESNAAVFYYLVDNVPDDQWGSPIDIGIHRGLSQPYTSHPRLDLFVGSMSPHKAEEMGCTICHDGQGSATEFKWASHSPNNVRQADEWAKDHGWFENHHWIFPMLPQRFLESNCLKCHHDVIELEPSDRFPEPPAPKLVEGWKLIQEFGCYGCHEINGYDGPDKRIGPDLRLEPNFFAVSQEILRDPGLSKQEKEWAKAVVAAPEIAEPRHRLMESLEKVVEKSNGTEGENETRLKPSTLALAKLLKDIDAPGSIRKVGPSLRYIRDKVDYDWLYSWIRMPSNFRPTTTMPQFFGQHHAYHFLDSTKKDFAIQGLAEKPEKVTDVEYTDRMEAVEIRAITEYLLNESGDAFEYLPKVSGTEAPSAERGKRLFQTRGCLACHSHRDFPGINETQGPDLTRVAAKFNTKNGVDWLYTWIKNPSTYHARTIMPILFLDPIEETDAAGQPTGTKTDPAADIVAFLTSVETDWRPTDIPARGELSEAEKRALEELTLEWLSGSFSRRKSRSYLEHGIPESMADRVKEDERLLIGMTDANRSDKLLAYIGRRSIGKYGCFGCHDIPGFEGAKPVGTGLADWGRKDSSKLAFEQIGRFLATHGVDGRHDSAAGHGSVEGHGLDPRDFDTDTGFFVQALNSHQRQGFIWQKLRMPRSFDFAKTENKGFNERLRMPLFPLDSKQREAIMTFILGLTNEAPAEKYIFRPTGPERAIAEGKGVLHKYNCGGCHVLEMDKWRIEFAAGQFEEPPEVDDFPFLAPHFTEAAVADSLKQNRRDLLSAFLHGEPKLNEETGKPEVVDDTGVQLFEEDLEDPEIEPYIWFTLWRDELIEGFTFLRGQQVLLPTKRGETAPKIGAAFPGVGGSLARYLFPHAIAAAKEKNPQVQGSEAWGWLPPPLIGEGAKVQTGWLHDFLLDPYRIRPAAVLRMPKFNMSSDEASKLVNYFAAVDKAEFPYEYDQRRGDAYLASAEDNHASHLDDAMKIVVDQNYCIKCHSVGDFQSKGDATALGPNLDQVYRRLRSDYVRRWVANPKRILPYTGMPVNIPYKPDPPHYGGVSQDLYPGTSIEQLNAVVDLLMNFDTYAKRQTDIDGLVKAATPTAPLEDGSANDAPTDSSSPSDE